MKRLLRKKSGFTLVEVIIAMAIMAILMGSMMLFFQPLIATINSIDKNERAESLIVTIEDYINRKIRYATQITVIEDIPFVKVNNDVDVQSALKQMGIQYNTSTDYEIGCISLRKNQFNPSDTNTIGTILCEEKVLVSSDGTLKLDTDNQTPKEKYKVFSDVFYNDSYCDFIFTDSGGAYTPQFDVLKMRSYVYAKSSDALNPPEGEVSSIALSSSSTYMTLLNIRINKATNPDYVSKFCNYTGTDSASTLDTYIFFIKRKLPVPAP